jgi:hypothetical protein
MTMMRRCFSNFNRVPVEAREFFRTNEILKAAYNKALTQGERLVVCLEGEVGSGKRDMLWRLQKQGYLTYGLPFVEFMVGRRLESLTADASLRWQKEFNTGMMEAMQSKEKRPGLLFTSQSPFSSFLELSRRGIRYDKQKMQISKNLCLIQLEADSIVVQRRRAEKTFNEPDSAESRLRNHLANDFEICEVGIKYDDSINSTSTKQGVASLLKLVGVEFDFVPPARPSKD